MRSRTDIPYFTAAELELCLDYPSLIEALEGAFRSPPVTPARAQHRIGGNKLILMPAWRLSGFMGVKISTVFPGNRTMNQPGVNGTYVLLGSDDGAPRAIMDGRALTVLRTAAASALAARYLARSDTSSMVMIGAGALAPALVRAHASVRSIRQLRIWNRTPEAADRLAAKLGDVVSDVRAVTNLDGAIEAADIISTATFSDRPLFRHDQVAAGTHIDLVGAFTPSMRETDGLTIGMARVFVDTREGALAEAGDLIQATNEGHFQFEEIAGDLTDLTRGQVAGRTTQDEITVFKSVGTALEDLAAAELAYRRLKSD